MPRYLLRDSSSSSGYIYNKSKSEYNTSSTQPYGRIITVITPLLTLTFLIYVVAFQLLHFTFVHATNDGEPQPLTGTLTPLLAQSHLVRHADPHQHLTLSLGLRPRNTTALQAALNTIVQNNSRRPEHILTPAEYSAHFSPTTDTYARLERYLKAAGFIITHTYTHHLLIDFTGTVAQTEKLFHTTINLYTAPTTQLYYANSKEPELPAWLQAITVSLNGLNNATRWSHADTLSANAITPGNKQSTQKGAVRFTASQCPQTDGHILTPAQIASAYGLDTFYQQHIKGQGQNIALFELATPQNSDITAYEHCFGAGTPTIETLSSSNSSQQTSIDLDALATEIDTELLLSAAPHLHTLKLYATNNDETSYLAQWASIIADDVPVITTSWEICEQDAPRDLLQQENIFFQMAALQGQNIFAASQASTCMQSPRTHSLHQSVMDPAAQPFVIGVGGTTITLQGTHYGQESTWQPATDQTGATGGGFSAYWSQPAWQHMFGIATTPGVHRAIPDVALNANPDSGYWIYCSVTAANCDPSHPWLSIGGTAIAAPLWAAFLALTDQLAEQTDKTRPGFLAPWLYRIANNPITYAHCFHDITANEQQTQTETTPTASVGYDLATGLGSYQAWNLANTVITMVNQANTALNGHNPVQVISGRP